MTKKILSKTVVLLVILAIICCIMQSKVYAAGSFSCNAGKQTMTVGETTTYTVNANRCGGRFEITTSDSSIVSISGETSTWIENGSHTVTLKANKAGKATITVKAANVADSDTAEDITGSKSVTITVNNPPAAQNPSGNNNNNNSSPAKSGDANLKSIVVGDKTYSNPSTDFTVTVNADVSNIEIKAETSHGAAKVTGTGLKELKTGTNNFTLTVTAENGATKNYIVRVRRLAEENTTPNVVEEPKQQNQPQPEEPQETQEVPEEPEELRLKYLMIEDVELIPEFDSEVFEYTIFASDIDKLDIIATANIEDAIIEIIGNENLIDGENEVIIRLSKEENTTEYKITVTKSTTEVVPPIEGEVQGPNDGEGSGFLGLGKAGWIIISSGVIVVVAGALGATIWFAHKSEQIASKSRHSRSGFWTHDDF